MGRKRICPLCKETIEAGEASVEYKGNRIAHERCVNIALRAVQNDKREKLEEKEAEKKNKTRKKNKPQAELKDPVSEEEYQEKKEYYQYIHSLVEGEHLPAKVYVLSEDYINKYGFTFKGMYQTLVYLNEILEKELTGDVVGLIPYYYSEMEKYYSNIEKIEKVNENKDISSMYKQRVVNIQPKRKHKKLIDINSVRIEGDNEE